MAASGEALGRIKALLVCFENGYPDLDVLSPLKITQSMPNLKFVFTVRDVKHNVTVDDKVFEKP